MGILSCQNLNLKEKSACKSYEFQWYSWKGVSQAHFIAAKADLKIQGSMANPIVNSKQKQMCIQEDMERTIESVLQDKADLKNIFFVAYIPYYLT